jgi:uncharacterized protein
MTIASDRALTFECEGQQLVGIVSGPEDEDLGVLVAVGGPQYRVGPHRQFVLLARRIAASGIPVMRFDYRGMGDSSGEKQTFCDTSPDIAAAIAAFQAACPALERVVLLGMCDGASASLLHWHATADARVAGMVLVNPWVFSDERYAQAELNRLSQRLVDRTFWSRLVRGRVDIAGAARSFLEAVRAVLFRKKRDEPTTAFQERMAEGMEAFRGPVLLVLSGQDQVCAEFLARCNADARWQALIGRSNVERWALGEADHTFSDEKSREKVEAAIVAWLRRSFRRTAAVKQLSVAASSVCSLILMQLGG